MSRNDDCYIYNGVLINTFVGNVWLKDEPSEGGGATSKTSSSDGSSEKETEKARDYSSIYSTISAPALAR